MSKKNRNQIQAEANKKNIAFAKSLNKKIHKNTKKNKTNKKNVLDKIIHTTRIFPGSEIRNSDTWKCKTYNESNQILSLARHLYCIYTVPLFILRDVFITGNRAFASMVLTIGQGKSFYKTYKNIFTKKEAHIFQNLKTDLNIGSAIILAKFKAAGISDSISSRVVHRNVIVFRVEEVLPFIKRYENEYLTGNYNETLDYIIFQLNNNPGFTLSKRTLNSVVSLSNQWHKELQKYKNDKRITWGRIRPDWTFTHPENSYTVVFEELLTSTQLIDEGKYQRHCVAAYVSDCESNAVRIYKAYSKSNGSFCRMTIEVVLNSNKITQIKKKNNRIPSDDEMKIVEYWANANNLNIKLSNW